MRLMNVDLMRVGLFVMLIEFILLEMLTMIGLVECSSVGRNVCVTRMML